MPCHYATISLFTSGKINGSIEKILNRAHSRLSQLHEDIAELKRQRIQIEVQIRAIIDAHTKLLEIGKEGMDALDEEDTKIKVLNK